MIIPIRCFTCSKVIADKFDYYHQEKNKLASLANGNDDKTDKDNLKFFNDIHTKEILDNLGLIRYCCRRSVMSSVDLMDVI